MAVNLGLQIVEWVNRLARRVAAKPGASGIMTIPNRQTVIDTTNEILTKFKKHGVPNDMIRSENDVKIIYNQILNLEDQQLRRNVISPGDPRHKELTEKILGKKKTTADLIDLGLVRKGKNVKKTTPKEPVDPKLVEEVKTQQTFDDFNARQNQTDVVADTVTRIISMEPVAALKEANKVIGRKGVYKNLTKEQSQKILKDSEDWIFQRDPDDLYDYNKKRPFRDDADPEDLAEGGRTGLSYLLAEDSNQRVPLKDGHSPGRRKFLKVAAGLASIPVVGKFFKWSKPLAKTAKVADVTSVPIKNIKGMPVWFKPLVNKVIKEGDDVSKRFATQERQVVHQSTLPNSKTDVIVTQDLSTGDVAVDIGMGKHGFPDGKFGQPVRLNYKASEWIEPSVSKSGKKLGGKKTKEDFWVEEAEFTGGHPENVKFEDVSFEKFGQHGSNFDEVEAFAKGKTKKTRKISSLQKEGEDLADHFSNYPTPDDYASGGRVPRSSGLAGMLGE
jgi:hypothetical protein